MGSAIPSGFGAEPGNVIERSRQNCHKHCHNALRRSPIQVRPPRLAGRNDGRTERRKVTGSVGISLPSFHRSVLPPCGFISIARSGSRSRCAGRRSAPALASNPIWRMICRLERGGSVCFPLFPTKLFDLLWHALASWNRGKLLGPLFEIGPVDFCPPAPQHRRDVLEVAGPPGKQFVNHQILR